MRKKNMPKKYINSLSIHLPNLLPSFSPVGINLHFTVLTATQTSLAVTDLSENIMFMQPFSLEFSKLKFHIGIHILMSEYIYLVTIPDMTSGIHDRHKSKS